MCSETITPEVLPAKVDASSPALSQQSDALSIEKVGGFVELCDKVIARFMKKQVDYDTIPGTNKPTLLKPGAEKLGLAFNLTPTYESLDTAEDHFKEFDYERPVWENGKKTNRMETVTTRGFYFYRVKCTLTHRTSGIVMGDCIATCASTERGRETSPGNAVLKIAEKRAYVGAILNVTFSSDRFVADMDDTHGGGGSSGSSDKKEVGPDTPIWFGKHKGTKVRDLNMNYLEWLIGNTDQNKDWAQAELDRRSSPKPVPAGEEPAIAEIIRLEAEIQMNGDWTAEGISQQRREKGGNVIIEDASSSGRKNYLAWLREEALKEEA